jgi:hypothetical protein
LTFFDVDALLESEVDLAKTLSKRFLAFWPFSFKSSKSSLEV